MMQQWSLERKTSAFPDYIILNTQRLVADFRKSLKALKHDYLREELLNKEPRLMESIVQALQFDQRVEMELRFGCIDVLRSEFDIEDREEVAILTDAVINLGYGLYSELKRQQAYHNGYLYYQYHSDIGYDIVMERLDMSATRGVL